MAKIRIHQDGGKYVNGFLPRVKTYGDDGEVRTQVVPDGVRVKGHPRRWLRMVRDTGHVVPATLTNHSAIYNTNCSFAMHQKETWRNAGWYPLGRCPVTLALAGELNPKSLCKDNQKAYKDSKGCQANECSESDPCKHSTNERDVRQERFKTQYLKRQNKFMSSQDKVLESNQEVTKGLVDLVKSMAEKSDETA